MKYLKMTRNVPFTTNMAKKVLSVTSKVVDNNIKVTTHLIYLNKCLVVEVIKKKRNTLLKLFKFNYPLSCKIYILVKFCTCNIQRQNYASIGLIARHVIMNVVVKVLESGLNKWVHLYNNSRQKMKDV